VSNALVEALKRYREFQVPHPKFGRKEWVNLPKNIEYGLLSS
jgi:hypothetical protein